MCDIIYVPRHFYKCVFKSDAHILHSKCFLNLQKTKSQQRFNAFVFTTWIIQSLYSVYIRSFKPLSVQPGLCRTWSETPKTVLFRDVAHIA